MPAQPRPPVLLTRPAAQSARFADQMRDRFGALRVVISPLLAPAFLRPALPDGAAAVIFTSETGVAAARAGGWILPDMAYCVGDRTAQAAQAAGFTARSAGGDAGALVALLTQQRPPSRLLHLRGADARGDVAATLTTAGVPTDEAVVYDQQPQPATPEAQALLLGDAPVIVPLFSPRSARLFIAAGNWQAPLWVAALSPAVADDIVGHAARLVVARHPDAVHLLDSIDSLIVS
jgi:uroporphyrinogen-III synthase